MPGKADTGLRFTDILFGFVIRELFLRLQDWNDLAWSLRCQLLTATVLVLGSWIGFRRSLHRTTYEIKFFNLPLWRFVLDQIMVILYFKVSVLLPQDPNETSRPATADLTRSTLAILVLIFVLYALWDLLGIWMAKAKDRSIALPPAPPKYPKLDEAGKEKTTESDTPNWPGLAVSAVALVLLALLWLVADTIDVTNRIAVLMFILATLVLVGYRFAKEVRTSWRAAS